MMRDLLVDPLMWPVMVVVSGVFLDYPCQMLAMKDEGVVQAFSS